MIRKKSQAEPREFLGIAFDLLAVGEKSMVTKMKYKRGDRVPEHSHPHEQSGYVISGSHRIRFSGKETILEAGDSYSIPGNIPHSLDVLEAGEVLDVFTPIREDYLLRYSESQGMQAKAAKD